MHDGKFSTYTLIHYCYPFWSAFYGYWYVHYLYYEGRFYNPQNCKALGKILQSVFIIMHYVNGSLKIEKNRSIESVIAIMINDIDDT